jgi:hypothetical protein
LRVFFLLLELLSVLLDVELDLLTHLVFYFLRILRLLHFGRSAGCSRGGRSNQIAASEGKSGYQNQDSGAHRPIVVQNTCRGCPQTVCWVTADRADGTRASPARAPVGAATDRPESRGAEFD